MKKRILYILLAALLGSTPICAQKEIKCSDYISLMHKIDKLHPPVTKHFRRFPRNWGLSCRCYKQRTKARMQKVPKNLQESIFQCDTITILIFPAGYGGMFDFFYEGIYSKGGKYAISSWPSITDEVERQSRVMEEDLDYLDRISKGNYSIKHSRNFEEYERCLLMKIVSVVKKEKKLFEYTVEDFYIDRFTDKLFKIE